MSNQITDSCTTYLACAVAMHADIATSLDWAKVGAVVLLVARLIKDIPDAIDTVVRLYKKYKDKRNGKSN